MNEPSRMGRRTLVAVEEPGGRCVIGSSAYTFTGRLGFRAGLVVRHLPASVVVGLVPDGALLWSSHDGAMAHTLMATTSITFETDYGRPSFSD